MKHIHILVRDSKEGEWRSLGEYELISLPRQGEHLELHNDTDNNILYKVVSVHHLLDSHKKAIDVYAIRDGDKLDVLNTF